MSEASGAAFLGLAGLGLLTAGYLKYDLKIAQLSLAQRFDSLEKLRKAVLKDKEEFPRSSTGIYCEILGKVALEDAKPLLAPVISLRFAHLSVGISKESGVLPHQVQTGGCCRGIQGDSVLSDGRPWSRVCRRRHERFGLL